MEELRETAVLLTKLNVQDTIHISNRAYIGAQCVVVSLIGILE